VHSHAWRAGRPAARCLLQLPPTRGAQAPTVARFQAWEAELWHRGGKIIAPRFGKREKLRCHHSADGVAPYILTPGIAAAIAIDPCHGFERTDFERLTEYVAGRNRSPASVATFISEHALFPLIFSIEVASASLHQLKTPTRSAGTSWVEDSGCVPVRLGSHLLARLTEHPCSIADDAIARARPPCCPSCTVRAGRPQVRGAGSR
jgi:hypothetical protein